MGNIIIVQTMIFAFFSNPPLRIIGGTALILRISQAGLLFCYTVLYVQDVKGVVKVLIHPDHDR